MVNPEYSGKIQSNQLKAKLFLFFLILQHGDLASMGASFCQNLTTHFQITGPL